MEQIVKNRAEIHTHTKILNRLLLAKLSQTGENPLDPLL
jgi:hypothetical protein